MREHDERMTLFETTASIGPGDELIEPASMFAHRHQFTLHKRSERFFKTELVSLGALKLGRVASSGHTVKLTESDHLTYLIPGKGSLDVSTRTDHYCAREGQTLLFGLNSRLTRANAEPNGKFSALALLIPMKQVIGLIDAPVRQALSGWAGMSIGHHNRPKSELGLRNYLTFLERECERADSALRFARTRQSAAALLMDLFARFLSECAAPASCSTADEEASETRLGRAREIINTRFRDPLTIAEIACDVGLTIEKFERSFQSAFGETPREALNKMRMEAARDELARGSEATTVAEIAANCGFAHISRFEAAYKAKYREMPLDTLKRAISRA